MLNQILSQLTNRFPAPEAEALYEDLKPPSREARLPRTPATRVPGTGRPTKRDRRALDKLRRES